MTIFNSYVYQKINHATSTAQPPQPAAQGTCTHHPLQARSPMRVETSPDREKGLALAATEAVLSVVQVPPSDVT